MHHSEGQALCSGESCLTESPGRRFTAVSPHLRGKIDLVYFSLDPTCGSLQHWVCPLFTLMHHSGSATVGDIRIEDVFQVSGRLFNSDAMPRRSQRLKDTTTNSNTSQIGGNGTDHLSGKLRVNSSTQSKLCSTAIRSVQLGSRYEVIDEMWTDNMSGTSSSVSTADGRSFEQDRAERILLQDSKVALGIRELLGLFRTLGEGFRLSCLFKCQEALEVYRKLPESQFNTGWVLCQVGKAYFELVDYLEADHYFELAHRLSPCTLDGMDIYSTVLYHLNEEMRLSYLAQELISIDRLSPQAWCAVGNCFALRKDHETALKNFQRSVQLDSRFAYAHTLCGHEYSALEDYENSIKFYRCALQVDERHYNAWYGLGVVYLRQEKFEFAEHHFRRAFQINPRSSVLMCYLGMALHSLKVDIIDRQQ
ncbi:Cell division cycle protein 27 homolog B [Zea mays]|uniref:Cell division cycle protein 27 homolog B n=1 Tax=Zea mays TaxID=4577 RepID=A0A1D6N4T4_MAIZE|nr:Cell division cycle protein 27 homolog B [Zea mays]